MMGKFDTDAFLFVLKIIANFVTVAMCCYGCYSSCEDNFEKDKNLSTI